MFVSLYGLQEMLLVFSKTVITVAAVEMSHSCKLESCALDLQVQHVLSEELFFLKLLLLFMELFE